MLAAETAKAAGAQKQKRRLIIDFGLPFVLLAVVLGGLFLAHQFPAVYTLDVSDPAVAARLNRFHNAEKNPQTGQFFRWSYPQSQLHLLPLDSKLRICLDIENPFPTPARNLEIALAGKPLLQSFPLQPGLQTYCVITGRSAGFLPHSFAIYKEDFLYDLWFGVPLEIRTEKITPPGDRRELGAVVRKVEVQSAAAAGTLGLPTLLEISLTCLLTLGTWGLLRSYRLRGWLLVLGTLLPNILWLSLVAFYRVQLANKIEFALFATVATLLALVAVRASAKIALRDLRNAAYALKIGRVLSLKNPPNSPIATTPKFTLSQPLASSLSGIAIFILVLQVAGNFWWGGSAWGFSRFSGLPNLLALGLGLLGLILAVATFSLKKPAWLNSVKLPALKFGGFYGKLFLAGLLTALLLYIFRIQRSYGDSDEIVSKLKLFVQYRAETGQDNFLIWREREPLDFALHFLLWRAMLGFSWWRPEYSYIFPAVLAGGLFLVVTTLLATLLTKERVGRFLIGGLVGCAATILVFFGYIESYTLVTLAALVYLWLAVLAISQRAGIIWPALALIVAVLLHPQAIFLGPSFLVLLIARAGLFQARFNLRQFLQEAALSSLIAAALVAAFGLLALMYNYSWYSWGIAQKQFGGSDNGAFKPLIAEHIRPNSRELYPVLSWRYLVFQFNLQMQIAPLALPLLAALGGWALSVRRRIAPAWVVIAAGLAIFFVGLVWNGAQAVIWLAVLGIAVQAVGLWLLRRHDPLILLLGSVAIYTWIFSLAWNPDLEANDWDLLSLNGIFTSLLVGYLLTRLFATQLYFKRVAFSLLAVASLLQFAWLLLNYLV